MDRKGPGRMRDVYAATFFLGRPGARPRSDTMSSAATETLAWLSKKYEIDAPSNWQDGQLAANEDRATWRLGHLRDRGAQLWELDWQQHDRTSGMVWQIHCQIGTEQTEARFTVRIAIDSVDNRIAPAYYEVGRPGVIPRLAAATGIHLDGLPLSAVPARASSGGIQNLLQLLLDPGRRLPVVVLTPTGATGRGLVDPRDVAFRLIGLAHVVEIVEREATFGLTDRLGQQLSVFGGAIRIYWPGLTPDSNPLGHPLWLLPRIEAVESSNAGVAKRLERQFAAIGVMRVRPDPLATELRATEHKALLGRLVHLQEELQRIMDTPGEPGVEWLAELENAYDTAKGLQAQMVTLQRENEDLRGFNEQLRRSFVEYSQALDDDDLEESERPGIPDDATTCSEAFELARGHLTNLVIPASAAVSLAELDSANESQGWGRSAWRALRALDAYAAEGSRRNGFWDWCDHSASGLWPATEKKLAMSESETVMNSRELREKRRFEVDRRVDESGRMLMVAHIKVAEGGGQQIPRIYFHDDTKGPTGKVHIGFFGPHRFVPNKSTN